MRWIPVLLVISITIASCTNNSNQSVKETKPMFEVVGVDISGSYDEMTSKAMEIVKEIVMRAKPGDEIFIRTISSESYPPVTSNGWRNTILHQKFTKVPPKPNLFDRKAKLRYLKALKEFNSQKADAMRKLDNMRFKPAHQTDIYGFIQAASDLFTLAPQGTRKVLAFATDLKDTANYKINPDLKGVEVVIFQFLSDADPSKSAKLKEEWAKKLKEWGATKVTIYPSR